MKETTIRINIRRFLQSMGFAVWDTEQNRPTRVTAGLPDLIAMGRGLVLFIEVKTETGTQTPAQKTFQEEAEANGATYLLWRSAQDAWNYLVARGIITPGG